MTTSLRIALVGDYDATVLAHQAIPRALALAAEVVGLPVAAEWVPTSEIHDESGVAAFDGIWCVPASHYRNMDGALRARAMACIRKDIVPPLAKRGIVVDADRMSRSLG